MNIQELRTNEASNEHHLMTDFAKGVNCESKRGFDTARRFDDVIFGISISMVLFLIASVIAIAF